MRHTMTYCSLDIDIAPRLCYNIPSSEIGTTRGNPRVPIYNQERGRAMPMVRAFVIPSFNEMSTGLPDTTSIQLLQYACEEIIPAGLNSKMGPLTPGSIEYIPTTVANGLSIDVVIDIEAYFYKDRAKNIEKRAKLMKRAFNAIFPNYSFAVFPKLVTAGWSSDTEDPEFDGNMSIEAAVARYKVRATRLTLDQH